MIEPDADRADDVSDSLTWPEISDEPREPLLVMVALALFCWVCFGALLGTVIRG